MVSSFDNYLKHVDQRGCLAMTALASEPDREKAEQLLEEFFLTTIQKVNASWPSPSLKVKIAAQCLDSLKSGNIASTSSQKETSDNSSQPQLSPDE